MSPLSDRERFLFKLFTAPQAKADVIAVFCGEDGDERVELAGALVRARLAPLCWVSGGIDDDSRTGASTAHGALISQGLHDCQIIVDGASQNTRDQALALAAEAEKQQWNRVILVASAYHLPRALLTAVQALDERRISANVRVIPASPRAIGGELIDGTDRTRDASLDLEASKVEQYREHVASYARGVSYLTFWEQAE